MDNFKITCLKCGSDDVGIYPGYDGMYSIVCLNENCDNAEEH